MPRSLSQIPSAARRSGSGVYPALRPALQRHVRTRPFRRVLTTPSTVTRPGSAVAAGRQCPAPGIRAKCIAPSCWPPPIGRLIGNRPARGATEGQRILMDSRRIARGGGARGRRHHCRVRGRGRACRRPEPFRIGEADPRGLPRHDHPVGRHEHRRGRPGGGMVRRYPLIYRAARPSERRHAIWRCAKS